MKPTGNWNINGIESITQPEAERMALEHLTIKEHDVYLVDFGGYFGYSALVFAEGRHIHYANDYELHHKYMMDEPDGRDKLRAWYISGLNSKLFTEAELAAPLTDYREYDRKAYYLHNYYPMRRPHLSIFGNFHDKDAQEEYRRMKRSFPVYDEYAFAYYADEAFVRHHKELFDRLYAAREAMKEQLDYWVGAFKYEMANHEYHINHWQGNFDVLSAFGNVQWVGDEDDPNVYFDQLGFNDTQRKAYRQARREYFAEMSEEV